MRFRITFNITGRQKMLPMDYQYSMASWIYNIIAKADLGYGRFLHKKGYRTGNKTFKFFSFSPLNIKPFTAWKDKGLFELLNTRTDCLVSFVADRAAESYIKGIFTDQKCFIGDKFNGLDLEVETIEALHYPVFTETMQYRALSPVCLSIKESGRHAKYLDPEHEKYAGCFASNLVEKACSMILNSLKDDLVATNDKPDIRFRLMGKSRSKLITIKPGLPEETRVRGYLYDFELTAPPEFHEIGYYAGFGEKNSMGFGCVEVV